MTKSHVLLQASFASLLILAVVSITGCGGAVTTIVSGKVTTGGQPVTGFIHFVGADGKTAAAPIGPTGGTYQVTDPPLGEVTVLVKAPPAPPPSPQGSGLPPGSTGAPMGPDLTPAGTAGTAGAAEGVPPPAKYADASSGLKYTVTAGKQQKDFELAP